MQSFDLSWQDDITPEKTVWSLVPAAASHLRLGIREDDDMLVDLSVEACAADRFQIWVREHNARGLV